MLIERWPDYRKSPFPLCTVGHQPPAPQIIVRYCVEMPFATGWLRALRCSPSSQKKGSFSGTMKRLAKHFGLAFNSQGWASKAGEFPPAEGMGCRPIQVHQDGTIMVSIVKFQCGQRTRRRLFAMLGQVLLASIVWLSAAIAAERSVPEIPGITVKDKFPGACVDCHINMPERGMDVRISTEISKWKKQVDPKLLAKIRAVLPKTMVLSGRHPALPQKTYGNIPASCMACHGGSLSKIPPFGPIVHSIHLTGGKENHFITEFQGGCTHCHKLNAMTGKWSIPSGAEK